LYKHVLDKPVGDNIAPVKAKKRRRPPTVMTKAEVRQVLNQMKGTHLLMAKVMYGGGLRLMECLRLRVMDLDFAKSQVYVRGKGGKDRFTTLSPSIYDNLKTQLLLVKKLHETDLDAGYGNVYIPEALARKYSNASREYRWQYVFPAKKLSKDPRSDKFRRHHVLESGLQKAVKIAVDRAGIIKRVGTHTLRHSFAIHLLEDGVNIRVVQELMGHADVKTTEIYTHVMEKDIRAMISPLDTL
jgi:integron integrase